MHNVKFKECFIQKCVWLVSLYPYTVRRWIIVSVLIMLPRKFQYHFLCLKFKLKTKTNKQTYLLWSTCSIQLCEMHTASTENLCAVAIHFISILNMWTLKCVGYYTKLKKEIRSHNHKQQEGWYFQEALQSESGKCKKQTYSTFHLIFIYFLNIWLIPRNPTAPSWMSNNTYWTRNLSAKKKKKKNHSNWNVHFKWLLSSVNWNSNTSQNPALLLLLHNTVLWGYKNSLSVYAYLCWEMTPADHTALLPYNTQKKKKKTP